MRTPLLLLLSLGLPASALAVSPDVRYTVGVDLADADSPRFAHTATAGLVFAPMAPRPETRLAFAGLGSDSKQNTFAIGLRMPVTPNISVASHIGIATVMQTDLYRDDPALDVSLSWLFLDRENWGMGLQAYSQWKLDQDAPEFWTGGLGLELKLGK